MQTHTIMEQDNFITTREQYSSPITVGDYAQVLSNRRKDGIWKNEMVTPELLNDNYQLRPIELTDKMMSDLSNTNAELAWRPRKNNFIGIIIDNSRFLINADVRYLHELQQILRLTGIQCDIEKIINLI